MKYLLHSPNGAIRTWPAICAVAIGGATFGLTPARAQANMPYEVWSKVFAAVNNMGSWKAPGATVNGTNAQAAAAGASRTWSAASGGVRLAESGAVALTLKNGVYVPITAVRAVSAAAVARGVGTLLGGPAGIILNAAAIGLPPLIDWINSDGGKKIRLGPNNVEVKDGGGYEYRYDDANGTSNWTTNGQSLCQQYGAAVKAKGSPFDQSDYRFEVQNEQGGNGCSWRQTFGTDDYGRYGTNFQSREASSSWRPALPVDLANVLPNYLMPIDLAPAGLEQGASYDATNISINGPASVDLGAPVTTSENLPVPAQSTQTRTQSGNPYNLSPNTPTVTGQGTSSIPITSGGETVNVPTRTTSKSTYNPTTNTTSTETVTTADPIRKETTTTDKGTLQYTPTEATVKITNITTTTIINNITNTVINSTTKETNNKPNTPETEPSDLCKDNPDILACQTLDTPDGTIPKSNKNISYSEESVFGFGSCPADRYLTLHTNGQSLKVTDWARSCDAISTYFRPLLLAMAAFVAWMILVPGKGAV